MGFSTSRFVSLRVSEVLISWGLKTWHESLGVDIAGFSKNLSTSYGISGSQKAGLQYGTIWYNAPNMSIDDQFHGDVDVTAQKLGHAYAAYWSLLRLVMMIVVLATYLCTGFGRYNFRTQHMNLCRAPDLKSTPCRNHQKSLHWWHQLACPLRVSF